jgi:ribosomal-protein-alanine N-acetyltransferase
MQIEDIYQVTDIDREAFSTLWPPIPFKQGLNNKLAHYLVAWEKSEDVPNQSQGTKSTDKGQRSAVQRFTWWGRHLFHRERFLGDYIVGYAALRQILDKAHLTSIAVGETYRRRGIGELLLISAINLATQLGASMITLEVRVSNLPAQALYLKYGFAKAGVRRRYYSDNGGDALIMNTEKLTTPSYQERFQQLKQDYLQKWGTNRCPLS